jgi:hypothetical protein
MEHFTKAAHLPACWDDVAADHYAMKRSFLETLEIDNNLQQKYWLFRRSDGRADSIVMAYHHPRFDLFMFTPLRLRFPVTMFYVPLSIARPSMIIGKETAAEVESLLNSTRGYRVILNMDSSFHPKNFSRGITSPRIVLEIRWRSMDDYLSSMRSPYRRRYKHALKMNRGLTMEVLPNGETFDQEMYALYEQVYNRSKTKIEKLTHAYFQKTPAKILLLKKETRPIGFVQMIPNGTELVFAFVGYDKKTNPEHDTYMNLLLGMVQYAIENRFSKLDLGQTADDAKLRLGGRYEFLFALASHNNPLMNLFVRMLSPYLQYRYSRKTFHVFRDDQRATKTKDT